MVAAFSLTMRAYWSGLAQLAFSRGIAAGVLILAAIALVSPSAAAGALIGALYGTVIGRFTPIYTDAEWAQGLAGFNTAIIGILWGAFLTTDAWHPWSLLIALGCCTALEPALRQGLARVSLPALSMPATATAIAVSLLLAEPGTWFWIDGPEPPFGSAGVLVAVLCIMAAMTIASASAAGWAVLLGAGAFLAIRGLGFDPIQFGTLWLITVPLAGFAMPAVFSRGPVAGPVAGTVAALAAATIWVLWMVSGLGDTIPPLLTPFILGVWLSIMLMRRVGTWPVLRPGLWSAAAAIDRARRSGRSTVALVSGETGETLASSSYLSGAWLDQGTPRSAFSDDRLRSSHRCRTSFWTACARLRCAAHGTELTRIDTSIVDFQRCGHLNVSITQDVLSPLLGTGADQAVGLHGQIDRIICIDCGADSGWPPGEIWKHCDLRCPECCGVLKPAIGLFGSDPMPNAKKSIERHLANCGVLLVLGPQAVEPATEEILTRVRALGGVVAFATEGALSYPVGADDIVISAVVERTLPLLAFLLTGLGLILRRRPTGTMSTLALPRDTR